MESGIYTFAIGGISAVLIPVIRFTWAASARLMALESAAEKIPALERTVERHNTAIIRNTVTLEEIRQGIIEIKGDVREIRNRAKDA